MASGGPLHPLGAVAVFLQDAEGRIVLLRRSGSHGAGSWCVPGGKIDFGETPEQAAAREVLEETGVAVDPAAVRTGLLSSDLFRGLGLHFLNVFCSAPLPPGAVPRIMEQGKADAIGLFALPAPLFPPLAGFLAQPVRPPFSGPATLRSDG